MGAVLSSCQKPEMEQRRHLKIGGLKRVSLLRFFSRLKRNEVPPRTGANSNKQENTTYAERPREKKDSMLSPHSPRAAPPQCYPHTRRAQHPLNALPTLRASSTPPELPSGQRPVYSEIDLSLPTAFQTGIQGACMA